MGWIYKIISKQFLEEKEHVHGFCMISCIYRHVKFAIKMDAFVEVKYKIANEENLISKFHIQMHLNSTLVI